MPLIAQVRNLLGRLWARRDLLIALVSLFVAVYAVVQERRISEHLNETALRTNETALHTKEISENLSTRYIGEFPHFIPEITEVLRSAKESISIACNVPGYGMYTDHQSYLEYISALQQQLANGRKIKIVVLTEREQEQFRKHQFEKLTMQDLRNPQNSASTKFQAFLR